MLQFLVLTALLLLAGGERIVRFISSDGNIYFGDAILPANTTDAFFSTRARVIQGDILGNFTVTREIKVFFLTASRKSSPNKMPRISKSCWLLFPARGSEPSEWSA